MTPLAGNRPISPHLSIYRWRVTMFSSIAHRASGIALFTGAILLVAWLWTAAYSPRGYQAIYGIMNAWYGIVMLTGWALAFYYHFCNGLRHLWWDSGHGLTIPQATRSGWLVIALSIAFTAFTWWAVYMGGI